MAGRVMDGAPNWPAALGAEDRRLAHQMTDYWTGFAAQGIPSAAGAPEWAPYGAAENFMRFGAVPALRQDAFPGMFDVREEVVTRRRAKARHWFDYIHPVYAIARSCAYAQHLLLAL